MIIYSDEFTRDEEEDKLISFDHTYLINPNPPLIIGHQKIIEIIKHNTNIIPHEPKCAYKAFGLLFRLLVIVYPSLPVIQIHVETQEEYYDFVSGYEALKGYKTSGLLYGWNSASWIGQTLRKLKIEGLIENYV